MHTMNCADFTRTLNRLFDPESGEPSAEWHAHVERCAACRSEWEACDALRHAIVAWNAEPLEADLADRVLAALAGGTTNDAASMRNAGAPALPPVLNGAPVVNGRRLPATGLPTASAHRVVESTHSRPQRTTSPRAAGRAVVAVVAASLLLLFIPPLITGDPEFDTVHSVAFVPAGIDEAPIDVAASADAAQDDAAVTALVRDAGSAYVSLATDVVVALRDATILVPSAGVPGVSAAWSTSPPVPGDIFPGALPAELQPIGRNLESALDFLWQVVPETAAPAT